MVGRQTPENSKCVDDDTRCETMKMNPSHQSEEQQDRNCSENEPEFEDEPQPIGDVIRVSDDGNERKKHFSAFEFEGNRFQLDDTILVAPEEGIVKPSVTIIKDIFQIEGESLMVRAQRFYRPEEVKKTGGGTWESNDARELFYSFHLDEFPAVVVMHECVIHLVPLHKPVPDRKENPGFIVRKFYDYVNQKVRNLTEKDCKDSLLNQQQLKSP